MTVNVSEPESLLIWLENHDASLITDLFLSPFLNYPHTAQRWCRLFVKPSLEATNIQTLSIYYDAEGPWGTKPSWNIEDPLHYGMGRSVEFIRGVARLKVHKAVKIKGYYAVHWPAYLEERIGLKPVVK